MGLSDPFDRTRSNGAQSSSSLGYTEHGLCPNGCMGEWEVLIGGTPGVGGRRGRAAELRGGCKVPFLPSGRRTAARGSRGRRGVELRLG